MDSINHNMSAINGMWITNYRSIFNCKSNEGTVERFKSVFKDLNFKIRKCIREEVFKKNNITIYKNRLFSYYIMHHAIAKRLRYAAA